MTTPKGYPCQHKEDRLSAEFSTVQPLSPERVGLDVVAHSSAYAVGTDTADSSTTTVITAAAHSAIKGDIIKWTSGAMSGRMFTVWETTTNTITLAQTMPSAPAAASAFTILRHTPMLTSSTGALSVTTTIAGKVLADGPYRHSYAVNVTTLAYHEIEASTTADINRLQIFDSSGQTMALATGAAGAETNIIYIPPGGLDIDCSIATGTRISIIAISATADTGEIVINALT